MVPRSGTLSILQDPPSDFTLSVMVVSPKPFRRGTLNALDVVVERQAQHALLTLSAVAAVSAFFHEIDGEVFRVSMTDGVGDPPLDAAIKRQVDGLAIGFAGLPAE